MSNRAFGLLVAVSVLVACSGKSSNPQDGPAAAAQDGLTLTPPTLVTRTTTVPEVTRVDVKVTANGTMNARVPMPVTSGAGGLTPQLALAYDSGSTDQGIAGVGWSLEGLSAITRCAKTPAQDGVLQTVQWSSTDAYCLDGDRLVLASGTYGTAGAEYRKELFDGSKIVQNGGNATGPASFSVWTKTGLKMDYGTTTDSQAESNLPGAPIRVWALARVTDTKGNYYTFTYAEDATTGEHVPTRIDYSANTPAAVAPTLSVRFGYEKMFVNDVEYTHPPMGCSDVYVYTPGVDSCITAEVAPTPASITTPSCTYGYPAKQCSPGNIQTPNALVQYVAGASVRTVYRLRAVDAYAGTQLSRQWQLEYAADVTPTRSRLTRVRECGWDGVCRSAAQFGWTTQQFSIPAGTVVTTGATTDPAIPVDFDRDGRSDLVQIHSDGSLWLSTSNGTTMSTFVQKATGVNSDRKRISFGDVNGDGYSDVLSLDATGNLNVWTSNGSTLTAKGAWGTGFATDPARLAYADVDGDNLVDVLQFNSTGTIELARSSGTAFLARAAFGTGLADDPASTQVADIDNDGRADVVQFRNGSIATWRSTGTGSTSATITSTEFAGDPKLMHLTEVNGDGYPDVWRQPSTNVKVWLGTGTGFATQGRDWAVGVYGAAALADLNGDGRADLTFARAWLSTYNGAPTIVTSSRNEQVLYLSTGTTFDYAADWDTWSLYTPRTFYGSADGISEHEFCQYFYPPPAGSTTNSFATPRGFYGCGFTPDGWYNCYADCVHASATDFADFNGDGVLDPYASLPDGNVRVAFNATNNGDRIGSVTDELAVGPTRTVNYVAGTNPSYYTKSTASVTDTMNIAPVTTLVASLVSSDGIGGTVTTSYKYAGARINTRGRGYTGFESVTTTEPNGIVTTTKYRQDFPYIGLVSQVTRASGSTTLSNSVRTYAAVNYGNRWLPYLQQDVITTNDLNGAVMPTVTTTQAVDSHGNVTSHAVTTTDGTTTQTVSTANTYTDNTTTWQLGRLTAATTTYSVTGKPNIVKRVAFTYNTEGLRATETIEPSTAYARTTTNDYDAFGNPIKVTITADGVSRVTSVAYSTDGRQITTETRQVGASPSAADHVTKFFYEVPGISLPTKIVDPNGLTTAITYNSLAHITQRSRVGVTETTALATCTASCPTLAKKVLTIDKTGAARVTKYIDALEREVRVDTTGYASRTIRIDTAYDTLGRISKKTRPYFAAAGGYAGDPPQWTNFTYDALARLTLATAPDGGTTQTVYNGLVTQVTNPESQISIETKGVSGKIVRSEQGRVGATAGAVVTFVYDAEGNVLSTTDANGVVRSATYDVRALRLTAGDPDRGTSSFAYNGFGDVRTITNARNQVTTLTYDRLGRVVTRVEPEGTTTYTYDTATMGVGQLARIDGPSSVSRTFTYDSNGRSSGSTLNTGGATPQTFTSSTTYDSAGRAASITYPSGAVVGYAYDSVTGQVSQLRDLRVPATPVTLWTATARNADGKVTTATYGNGVVTTRTFLATTGSIQQITTKLGTTTLDNATYTFDKVGNLKSRNNTVTAVSENYTYDSFNRLKTTTLGTTTATYGYDAIGNLTSKSDVGTYTYTGTKLTGISTGATFSYDNTGNVLSGDGRTFTWTSFNMPATITKGGTTLAFAYDGDHARISQSSAAGTLYYASAGMYEVFVAAGVPEQRHYLKVDDELVGELAVKQGVSTLRYFHTDHLGSLTLVTNPTGGIVERLSWDAWGARRLTNGTAGPVTSAFDRGFTGHEQLDALGLVHMNGRIYDPRVARFVSPDPITQEPDNAQNYARYSYVFNSPLSSTDPSGYFSLKGFRRFLRQYGGLAIGFGIGLALPIAFPTVFTGLWGSVAAGAIGGFVAGAVSGGGPKSMLWGAITGGAWGAVGFELKGASLFAKVATHAAVGGALTALQGGNFFQGALANGLGTFAGNQNLSFLGSFEIVGQAAAAAVAGGTAAAMTGGSFANGAYSAAFGYLYNEALHACYQPALQALYEKVAAARANAPEFRPWGENQKDSVEVGERAITPVFPVEEALTAVGPGGIPRKGVEVTWESLRAALKATDGYTVNSAIYLDHVADFARALEAGAKFPPVQIVDGVILDGNHRYLASVLTGIPVPIVRRAAANPFERSAVQLKNPIGEMRIKAGRPPE